MTGESLAGFQVPMTLLLGEGGPDVFGTSELPPAVMRTRSREFWEMSGARRRRPTYASHPHHTYSRSHAVELTQSCLSGGGEGTARCR